MRTLQAKQVGRQVSGEQLQVHAASAVALSMTHRDVDRATNHSSGMFSGGDGQTTGGCMRPAWRPTHLTCLLCLSVGQDREKEITFHTHSMLNAWWSPSPGTCSRALTCSQCLSIEQERRTLPPCTEHAEPLPGARPLAQRERYRCHGQGSPG